ncbi:uncharacterized protein LOC100251064 isoform X3 [Vitis vinifera]|uniref:uncharacterized protein LOC100251064 isoform X3 n=1 Tax=Vitis vinifera TaxID=29760 RepID=UPI0005402697|nr:uncharacterized protein LOC100251064 isoform X3 [Vitis vinifera]|eukprot:XP_010650081.1 PREDICTED: uncharacterized protein LOC100251064 isoform X3 [Vitis vinifera]
MGSRSKGNYTNPCLTLHQPWASLLVYGIKRVEGRSWPAPLRGRLWIHAASKVPDSDTIKAMENFYREIYAVNGIADLKFPEHYPVSRLLGCVEVVGCVKCEELACWKEVPEGIYEAAVRGLRPVQAPLPVKFLLPEPQDPLSLKPGSLVSCFDGSKAAEDKKPEGLLAAIAGARAAATQFSKNDNHQSITMQGQDADVSTRTREESEEFEKLDSELIKRADAKTQRNAE